MNERSGGALVIDKVLTLRFLICISIGWVAGVVAILIFTA